MKLLFDENLSFKLVTKLADIFPDAIHARDLLARDDVNIWQFAKENKRVIITKDADFNDLSSLYGFPPFVVWLRTGNCKLTDMENILRTNSIKIRELISQQQYGVIELSAS